MTYSQITARLTVPEERCAAILEALHKLFDGFVVEGQSRVFDAEMTSTTVCDVENADDVGESSCGGRRAEDNASRVTGHRHGLGETWPLWRALLGLPSGFSMVTVSGGECEAPMALLH